MEFDELIRLMNENERQRKALGFDHVTLERLKEERELIKNAFAPSDMRSPAIKELMWTANDGVAESIRRAAGPLFPSEAFQAVRDATLSSIGLLNQSFAASAVNDFVKLAGTRTLDWKRFHESIAPSIPVEKFLSAHFAEMGRTSVLAQATLAGLDISKIGGAFNVAAALRRQFGNQFLDLSKSYRNLFKSFEDADTSIFRLPPAVSRIPTIELFNAVELLDSTIDAGEEQAAGEERIVERRKIRESSDHNVMELLGSVNQDWVPILEGAQQAARSDNPDKVRHCLTSLRELTREVLYYLSPNEEIAKWSTVPDDFHNGQPTRQARLKFISRKINHDGLTDFVEKDIASTLSAIKVFHAGTHSASSKLTNLQISTLIAKVEWLIIFVFKISDGDN